MSFRFLLFFAIATVAALQAQTPALTISTASLTINPAATDSYTLQGAFTGLDFSSAQSVALQVGPFSATIPIGSFVQQPSNVFTYQDSTGQTPYWISSLIIDANAQTFTAQATGVVLAGIGNPFAVKLGTGAASGCSMARVQQSAMGAYRLTSGDGANAPCQIPDAPVVEPPTISAGAAANVTFTIDLLPTAGLDPATVQLFRADGNAQPAGAPLCTLTDNGDGTFSCTATFSEAAPAAIPLLVQAAAGTQTVLSPGFSLQVIGPQSDATDRQLSDIQNAMSKVQQNFMQYGDSAYSRILSLQAVRAMLQPKAGLNGQPVELCPDGLSIGVRTDSGIVVVFLLNDLFDLMGGGANTSAALVPRKKPRPQFRAANPRLAPAQAGGPGTILQCGLPTRDIDDNNAVLLWDPGATFWGTSNKGPQMVQALMASKCPKFQVDTLSGAKATDLAFDNFLEYGSIIINSHGGQYPGTRGFIMTGINTGTKSAKYSPTDPEGASCVFIYPLGPGNPGSDFFKEWDCYIHVYASYVKEHAKDLRNAVIFSTTCFGGAPDLADAFTPSGRNNAYFGYDGIGDIVNGPNAGVALFNSLVKQYSNTQDAYTAAAVFPSKYGGRLQIFGDMNLGYLGNPKLFSPQQGSLLDYTLGPGDLLNLQAELDGASTCDGVMNYHWTNTAVAGHLRPGSGGGGPDDFTNSDFLATYKANPSANGIDVVAAAYFPDPSNPLPAAQACTAGTVDSHQMLHIVFDGQGTAQDFGSNGDFYTADLAWHAAWDLEIGGPVPGYPGPASGGYFEGALPGASVTGTSSVFYKYGNGNSCAGGPPVINTMHGGTPSPIPQSPFLGSGLPPQPGSTIIPMWVDLFGGDDYHLCDGYGLAGVGSFGSPEPGYPGWDTPASIAKFNLDLSQWAGQPDHTSTMPVSGDFTTIQGPFNTDEGEVHFTGTLTFSTKTVKTTSPSSVAPSRSR